MAELRLRTASAEAEADLAQGNRTAICFAVAQDGDLTGPLQG